jgi:hypothetical protein
MKDLVARHTVDGGKSIRRKQVVDARRYIAVAARIDCQRRAIGLAEVAAFDGEGNEV